VFRCPMYETSIAFKKYSWTHSNCLEMDLTFINTKRMFSS